MKMQAVVFLKKLGNFGMDESGNIGTIRLSGGSWEFVTLLTPKDKQYANVKAKLDAAVEFRKFLKGN